MSVKGMSCSGQTHCFVGGSRANRKVQGEKRGWNPRVLAFSFLDVQICGLAYTLKEVECRNKSARAIDYGFK